MYYIWDQKKDIIIFGTGHKGEELYENLINHNYKIKYFIDNNKKKQHVKFKGKFILPPRKILDEDTKSTTHIIVASGWYKDISNQLNEYGLLEGLDYSIWNDTVNYGDFSGVILGVSEKLTTYKSKDEFGNLVFDKKNKKVYRVIKDEKENCVKDIINICSEENLFGKYIINTKILDDKKFINRKLVLEHEFIDPITYPSEWTGEMVRDAALFYLEFLEKLNKLGLRLSDANSYNLAISKAKYIWLDFGSITKQKLTISTIYEFIDYYINTIILFDKEDGMEKVLWSYPNPLTYKDIYGYLTKAEIESYDSFKEEIHRNISNGYVLNENIDKIISLLRSWVINISLLPVNSKWKDYHNESLLNLNNPSLWSPKNKKIVGMIERIKVDSILDIAGNAGFFCFIMALRGKRCILCDLDRNAIRKAYEKIIEEKYDNITPVLMNFNQSYIQSKPISEEERFKSDLVIATAIEHHLVFLEQLTFDDIIERLYGFTNKYLLIEFICPENELIESWTNEKFYWYTYENFLLSLNKKFKVVDEEKYEEYRILFMCEKL